MPQATRPARHDRDPVQFLDAQFFEPAHGRAAGGKGRSDEQDRDIRRSCDGAISGGTSMPVSGPWRTIEIGNGFAADRRGC